MCMHMFIYVCSLQIGMCTCLCHLCTHGTHVKIFLHALDGSAYHSGLLVLHLLSLQGMDYSLGTDSLGPTFPCREPKVNMWRAQSGLLSSEWKVGDEYVLQAWLLVMLSLPIPRQPSAPCYDGWIEVLLLFKKHRKLVDWQG